jgi:hypothetical protein
LPDRTALLPTTPLYLLGLIKNFPPVLRLLNMAILSKSNTCASDISST